MSQRDGLEMWRVLVNGAADTAIAAVNKATEAIVRHRATREHAARDPDEAGPPRGADATPEAAGGRPPDPDHVDRGAP